MRAIPGRVIFLDFGGTLDADGIPWGRRFHESYQATGGTLDFDSFEPVFRLTDRAMVAVPGIERLGFSEMIEAQARLIVEGLPEPERSRLDPARIAGTFHAAALTGIRRNIPFLEQLAAAAGTGIISNFCGNLDRCLEELELSRYFRVIVDSGRLGVAKPDPAIFRAGMKALAAAARDCWMVGDNFESDIRPAGRLGMSTAWLAPAGRPLPPDSGDVPTVRLTTLPDLAAVLAERDCRR